MNISISKVRSNVNNINSYLLIAFAFILPLSVAIGNIVAGLILIFWLIKADFKNDFEKLKNNSLVIAVMAFYLLHYIGLIWTQDLEWGMHIIKKETKFLLLPLFMLFVQKEHIKYYIIAFLSAITLSEIASYLVWFELIPPFKHASVYNPTPFMSHISYNPFLTIAIYLLLYFVLFDNKLDNKQKLIYVFFIITMSINMFITGGRAGQVMYFSMLTIVIFQYFNKRLFLAFIVTIIAISSISVTAYNFSDLFKQRVNLVVSNIEDVKDNPNTSVGSRLIWALNSFEVIKENPLIGVGTGDFKLEYTKIHIKNNTTILSPDQPHNMYILELVQFGLIGLGSLLFILYTQIKIAKSSSNNLIQRFGITLPILFGIIMFSDSYLLGHYTTMLFILFSAILYKDYDEATV